MTDAVTIVECLKKAAELSGLSITTISDSRTANKFLEFLSAQPGWRGTLGWKNEGPFACTVTGPTGKVCTAEDADPAVAIYSAALMHFTATATAQPDAQAH
ncbi:MAG: hypothetical protein H0U59_05215 [Gemmatimonadaceae bacterium]|nr:hypothetical protein [Gemmatimonadaceae bacterium]